MPRRRAAVPPQAPGDLVADYRHADKRKHSPPAGLASQGRVQETPKIRYAHDPHLPPVLRFDATASPRSQARGRCRSRPANTAGSRSRQLICAEMR